MRIIHKAPKYSTCWFCHSKVEGSHARETVVQYSCRNHQIEVQWFCRRLTYGKWSFHKLDMFLPKHFKLSWNFHINTQFNILEWEKSDNKLSGAWVLIFNEEFKPKTFPVEWVLLQSPERLYKLLQLYQTFS